MRARRARDGTAMLQVHTHNFNILNRPYDLQGTMMPSAVKAERYGSICLNRAGSSGYLGPGASMRILE